MIKTRKGKDREEEKKEEQGIQMVTIIVDINLSISVVTLEASDLKVSINRFSEWMKLCVVYGRPILDVNIL